MIRKVRNKKGEGKETGGKGSEAKKQGSYGEEDIGPACLYCLLYVFLLRFEENKR